MAKYVLVQFDNDAEADGFVQALQVSNDAVGEAGMKIVGVFKKPTLFCECEPREEKSARGAKWGWWVCKKCGKAKKGMWQSPRNLLDPIDIKSRERQSYLQTHEPNSDKPPTVTIIEPQGEKAHWL